MSHCLVSMVVTVTGQLDSEAQLAKTILPITDKHMTDQMVIASGLIDLDHGVASGVGRIHFSKMTGTASLADVIMGHFHFHNLLVVLRILWVHTQDIFLGVVCSPESSLTSANLKRSDSASACCLNRLNNPRLVTKPDCQCQTGTLSDIMNRNGNAAGCQKKQQLLSGLA